MIRLWLVVAGLGGLASVLAGAAAAHLSNDPRAAELLRTGALYGMVHAAGLVAVTALTERREKRPAAAFVAGWGFAIGIVLFSGSLFALALWPLGRLQWAIPVGGLSLMAGWAGLVLLAWRFR